MYKLLRILLSCLAVCCVSYVVASPKIFSTRNSVVNVKVYTTTSPYGGVGESKGTAFYLGNGLFCTNSHIVGNGVSTYDLMFELDGAIVEAVPVWSDPHLDIAFLRVVNKNELPKKLEPLKISDKPLKKGEQVFVFGSSGGKAGSLHQGFVSDINYLVGHFSEHSTVLSINTHSGASGSPVINADSEVAGLLFAGNGSGSAFAIMAPYIRDVYNSLAKGQTPKRQDLGVVVRFESLDEIKKYLPKLRELSKDYSKNYPGAQKKIIVVRNVWDKSPAQAAGLKANDVLWEIDGQVIANDYYKLHRAVNEAKGPVKLKVINEKGINEVSITPKDLSNERITQLVEFGGSTFYRIDPFVKSVTGLDDGVMCSRISAGSFYNKFYFFSMEGNAPDTTPYLLIEGIEFRGELMKIKTIDDLVKAIGKIHTALQKEPKTVNKVNFRVFYVTMGPIVVFDYKLNSSHSQLCALIEYTRSQRPPRISKLDVKQGVWQHENLGG